MTRKSREAGQAKTTAAAMDWDVTQGWVEEARWLKDSSRGGSGVKRPRTVVQAVAARSDSREELLVIRQEAQDGRAGSWL
jgi:hypothetical protein